METIPSKFKPFIYVKKDKKSNYVIVAGNTQVAPNEFKTTIEADEYLQSQPYEMFINLYSIFKYYENKENQKVVEKDA